MDTAPHILVVDDDREIRDLLARFLEKQGFRVTTAREAREARKVWPLGRYHIVVLDLMMPGESGLDFARWLRSQSPPPRAKDAGPGSRCASRGGSCGPRSPR